ncbi:MAG: serine hydrolase [Alphaproteobacteria bacterium]|nr:serine hydrolase [Alphaproteobacteria bacterium]
MSKVLVRFAIAVVVLGLAALAVLVAASEHPSAHDHSRTSVAIADPNFADAIERARTIIDRHASAFPSISVAVAVQGHIVWSETRGLADIGTSRLATARTRYSIYSASKAITGAIAARLVEQGKLKLDADLRAYLPTLKGPLAQAKVWQLVSHTAGIRDYYPFEWFWVSSKHCATTQAALRPFVDDELESAPGTRYDYSSYEYVLLSAVLEHASGETYDQLLGEIADLAGMTTTSRLPADESDLAVRYGEGIPSGFIAHRWIDNSCKYGAGGLWSTPEDMARFGAALIGGKIVGPAGLARIFTPFKTSDGKPTIYGMGWGLGKAVDGHRYAAHSGGGLGGRSAIAVLPDDGVSVAIAANFEGPRVVDDAAKIGAIFAAK